MSRASSCQQVIFSKIDCNINMLRGVPAQYARTIFAGRGAIAVARLEQEFLKLPNVIAIICNNYYRSERPFGIGDGPTVLRTKRMRFLISGASRSIPITWVIRARVISSLRAISVRFRTLAGVELATPLDGLANSCQEIFHRRLFRSEFDAVYFSSSIVHVKDLDFQFLEAVGYQAREKGIEGVRRDPTAPEQLSFSGIHSADCLRIVAKILPRGMLREKP